MAKETQAEIQSKLHEVKAKLEAKKKEFDEYRLWSVASI